MTKHLSFPNSITIQQNKIGLEIKVIMCYAAVLLKSPSALLFLLLNKGKLSLRRIKIKLLKSWAWLGIIHRMELRVLCISFCLITWSLIVQLKTKLSLSNKCSCSLRIIPLLCQSLFFPSTCTSPFHVFNFFFFILSWICYFFWPSASSVASVIDQLS